MNKRSGGGGSWNRRGKPSNKELSGMRRQRSLEWRNERTCSSSDDEIARPVESQIFASLLAQAQKEFKGKFKPNEIRQSSLIISLLLPIRDHLIDFSRQQINLTQVVISRR